MISKAKLQYIQSLNNKKGRNTKNTFVAETPKVVEDMLPMFQPELIVATNDWLEQNLSTIKQHYPALLNDKIAEVLPEELRKISFLQHPQKVLCVFKQRETNNDSIDYQQLTLALDNIQDPGNLGTIIRIADWFGIETIVCSHHTADVYNPKVVQATMGSMARVRVIYTDLANFIDTLPSHYPIYGTLFDGNDIYQSPLSAYGLIVMGNEGNGISEKIRQRINHKLFIPSFPTHRDTAESLNVAIATAITCSEFRRQHKP